MKLVFALLGFSLALPALAKQNPDFVTFDMRLAVNGKFVAGPRMIMRYGSKGAVGEEEEGNSGSYTVEVSPTKESDRTVALHVTVTQKNAGIAKIIFATKMIAEDGITAELSHSEPGLQDLKLEITPTL